MSTQKKKRATGKAFTDFRAVMTLMDITADSSSCGNGVCGGGGVGVSLAN